MRRLSSSSSSSRTCSCLRTGQCHRLRAPPAGTMASAAHLAAAPDTQPTSSVLRKPISDPRDYRAITCAPSPHSAVRFSRVPGRGPPDLRAPTHACHACRRLDNGLRFVLVHDPEVVFAATAVNVQVRADRADCSGGSTRASTQAARSCSTTALRPPLRDPAVQVGYMHDPPEVPGLAHFLEHAVHLGSALHPDEGEYKAFLAKHGGASNASTGQRTATRAQSALRWQAQQAPHASICVAGGGAFPQAWCTRWRT